MSDPTVTPFMRIDDGAGPAVLSERQCRQDSSGYVVPGLSEGRPRASTAGTVPQPSREFRKRQGSKWSLSRMFEGLFSPSPVDLYPRYQTSHHVNVELDKNRLDSAARCDEEKVERTRECTEPERSWLDDGFDMVYGINEWERSTGLTYRWEVCSPDSYKLMETRRQELLDMDISSNEELTKEWLHLTKCRSEFYSPVSDEDQTDAENYDPLLLGPLWNKEKTPQRPYRGGVFKEVTKWGDSRRPAATRDETPEVQCQRGNRGSSVEHTVANLSFEWDDEGNGTLANDVGADTQRALFGFPDTVFMDTCEVSENRPRSQSLPSVWLSNNRSDSGSEAEFDMQDMADYNGYEYCGRYDPQEILNVIETDDANDDDDDIEFFGRFAALALWIPTSPSDVNVPPLRLDKSFVWSKADSWIQRAAKAINDVAPQSEDSDSEMSSINEDGDCSSLEGLPQISSDTYDWQFNPDREDKVERRRRQLLEMDLDKNPTLISEWLALVAFRSFLSDMDAIDGEL